MFQSVVYPEVYFKDEECVYFGIQDLVLLTTITRTVNHQCPCSHPGGWQSAIAKKATNIYLLYNHKDVFSHSHQESWQKKCVKILVILVQTKRESFCVQKLHNDYWQSSVMITYYHSRFCMKTGHHKSNRIQEAGILTFPMAWRICTLFPKW